MAILTFKSKSQVKADILTKLIAQLGLNDVNAGSVIDILSDAVAQEDFAQYVQMAQIARLVNLDAITGDDLDNKAFEYGLQRELAKTATGRIDILRPIGFEKVSTTFYAGSPAALIGDTVIDVNDASNSLIGTSGTLIIGRGTNNEEEITYSAAPVNNTNYWRFTLDAGLANNHSVEETVILKQGNDESILAGTIVIVPASGVTPEIQFTIDEDAVLQAGEDRINNVPVTAVVAGSQGNIPIKAIENEAAFSTPPFAGARAENNVKFTTGRDRQTDDELRDAIRNHVQSLSRGVKEAVLNAIVGLVDTETAKRVVSASVVLPLDECGPVKVYIDDGTGFEPSFENQGFEEVFRNTSGGETRFQLDLFPLVQAQVENNIFEPYDLSSGALTLTVSIGNVTETITFNPGDFPFSDIASAEQVVTAINDKSVLLEARTATNGTNIVINAKEDTNEEIQVLGGTANSILGFPTDLKETLFLYVDDEKKSKDGATAILDSQNQAPYDLNAIGLYPHTLTIVVDGKSANPQTATINLADVIDPAAVTASEIATVLNRDISGITAAAEINNTITRITSNTPLSSNSKLQVTGGSMNDATNGLNFVTTEISGIDGDFKLNKELGIIEFSEALPANVSVTAGSQFTRGKLRAALPELYAPSNLETLVISVDGGADQTITFDNTFIGGVSAENTAAFINNQLEGATAISREIGTIRYLEINTNTYKEGVGSIEIKSTSTSNGSFNFELDTVKTSIRPHKAFNVATVAGPYEFAENDSLVTIIDNDIVNNTFNITMDFDSIVTSGTSTTVFASSSLGNIFPIGGELIDYYAAFTSGANTDQGTVNVISDQGGGTFRYEYDTAPVNMALFATGDLFEADGFDDSVNNGNFIITGISLGNWIEVTNQDGVSAAGQTGTGKLCQRRQIIAYSAVSGSITVGVPFSSIPAISDDFIVLPSTINNLVKYINNTRITSFSLKGIAEGVEQNTKLQLSSKSEGSDGFIQTSGGDANNKLQFTTVILRGLQGYSQFVGLTKLVHSTIYGDDTDLVAFPGIGAAGITFIILAPTVREVEVDINVTLTEGVSIASVENEIKSAISGYINSLGVGDDVIIEEINCAVLRISSVKDIELNTPTANIAIADNELPRTKDSIILVG